MYWPMVNFPSRLYFVLKFDGDELIQHQSFHFIFHTMSFQVLFFISFYFVVK